MRLDGDATIETPGWLERMLAFYRSDERIGVVVAKIVFDSGHVHSYGMNIVGPEGVHDRGTRHHRAGRAAARSTSTSSGRSRPESDEGHAVAEIDGAIGCCTMFSRELAERIGGFDRRYDPVGFEDFDFALGARRLDRKVFFFPEVEVVHRLDPAQPAHGQLARRSGCCGGCGAGSGGLFPQRVAQRRGEARRSSATTTPSASRCCAATTRAGATSGASTRSTRTWTRCCAATVAPRSAGAYDEVPRQARAVEEIIAAMAERA